MNPSRALGLLGFAVLCHDLSAASVEVTVKDASGTAVPDAVVYAQRSGVTGLAKKQTVIDQRDKQFVPYVTAVQVGTSIMFPNSDNIRHHVYSFSPAKSSSCHFTAVFPRSRWSSTRWDSLRWDVIFTI